jgi:hypothetical protein
MVFGVMHALWVRSERTELPIRRVAWNWWLFDSYVIAKPFRQQLRRREYREAVLGMLRLIGNAIQPINLVSNLIPILTSSNQGSIFRFVFTSFENTKRVFL